MTGRAWGIIILILLLAVAGGATWLRCEGTAPTIEAPEALLIGGDGTTVVLGLSDEQSGVPVSHHVITAHDAFISTRFREADRLEAENREDTRHQVKQKPAEYRAAQREHQKRCLGLAIAESPSIAANKWNAGHFDCAGARI